MSGGPNRAFPQPQRPISDDAGPAPRDRGAAAGPKAIELVGHHEALAGAIQRRIDEQCPPLVPTLPGPLSP
jgi:hypothetical protein